MNLLALLKALLDSITGVSKAVEVRTKPHEVQISEHEIKKKKLTANQMISIYDKDYIRLRDHWEIDIATDVNFVHDDMDEEDRRELIELLTNRITRYRKRFPIRFKKWLNK